MAATFPSNPISAQSFGKCEDCRNITAFMLKIECIYEKRCLQQAQCFAAVAAPVADDIIILSAAPMDGRTDGLPYPPTN